MTPSIDELIQRFDSQPTAHGGRWSVDTLVPDRAYLTRDESGRYTIFLAGEVKTFGTYPKLRAIQHVTGVVPVPGGIPFAALKISSPGFSYGNRAIAHVAYEIVERLAAQPTIANASLVAEVAWILELLSSTEPILSPEEQKGLIGELQLLRKLITSAVNAGLPPAEALARWWGWDRSKRDFAASGTAIEVKATSLPSRRHRISSIEQLEPHGDEVVFLYSVGVRLDASAPRKLPDIIREVRAMLTDSSGAPDSIAQHRFDEAVRRYGYDSAHEAQYRAAPGVLNFHLPPKVYLVADLDYLKMTSFKGDALPTMVTEVSYLLDVKSQELSTIQESAVFDKLVRSPATSG